MKRVVYIFCLAWVFYSIAASGYAIVQKEWLPVLAKSPSEVQAETGDLSNRASVLLARQGAKLPEEALLFFDHPEQINGLAIGYWLYPLRVQSMTDYTDKTIEEVIANPGQTLGEIIATTPEIKTIIFIGSADTLQQNQALLTDFKHNIVLTDQTNGDIFVILERT